MGYWGEPHKPTSACFSLLSLLFSSSFSVILFSLFILSVFLCFLYFFVFCVFPYSLLFVVYCAQLRHFYTACRNKIYHFYSSTIFVFLAYCGCLSRTAHWSDGYLATTTTLCWPRYTSFPDKSSFVLFCYFPWHSYPDKGCVSLLLTPIACT